MNTLRLLLLLNALFLSQSAEAGCPNIEKAFAYKMKEYRAYREKNEAAYLTLMKQELDCKTVGAKVSASIASKAEAQSCEAQGDASVLNADLADIGARCQSHFSELNVLQVKLKTAFEKVRDDLEAGADFMAGAKILQEFCPREIELGKKMVKAFLKLESEIVLVETRSWAGNVDYGKFKDAAVQLKTMTAAANRNCGNTGIAKGDSGAQRSVSSTYGTGTAAVLGKSPRPSSDISGADKAMRDAAKARQIVSKQ